MVRGEQSVKHIIKTDFMKGGRHFPGDWGSHRKAEFLTQGRAHSRRHLDNHTLIRVSQGAPYG